MHTEPHKTEQIDSTSLFFLVLKWKKHLFILVCSAIAVSALVSFLITPMYKATVKLFPVRPGSVSKELFSPPYSGDKDILRFGEEDDSERMMEILNSDEILNRLDNKYALLKHYDIEADHKYKRTLLKEEYKDNVTFKKTEFQSVLITVLDKSPDTAAGIANDIAAFLDTVVFDMQMERAKKGFRIIEDEYQKMEAYIHQLEDSLAILRKLGVQDYDLYTRQYSKALASGKTAGLKALEEKMELLGKFTGEYVFLKARLTHEAVKFTELRAKYVDAKVDISERLPQKFVIEKASVPEKKYTPIRWLIVAVSTLSALLMGILAIIGIENFKKYPGAGR